MFNTFKLAFRIDSAISWNTFIYNLQQLPLIGRIIKSKWYGESTTKTLIAILIESWGFIWMVIRQFFYFGFFIGLPIVLIVGTMSLHSRSTVFSWGFFTMNILLGAFYNHALSADYSDSSYTKLVFMNLKPREYYLSKTIYAYVKKAVAMLPAYSTGAYLSGLTFLQALILYFGMYTVRVIADGLYFSKIGMRVRSKRNGMVSFQILAFGLGMALYLSPLLVEINSVNTILDAVIHFISGVPGLILYSLIGAIGILLIRRKADYNYLKKQELLEGAWQLMNLQEFDTTKEYAFNEKYNDQIKEGSSTGKHGYEYLDAIFYDRHRSLFKKRMWISAILTIITIGAAVAVRLIRPEDCTAVLDNVLERVGIFIFIVYLAAYRDAYTKALFSNVDKYLLHYNWYRRPDVILKNYVVRLRRSFFMNFAITLPMMSALIVATLIVGSSFTKAIPALGTILTLTLFYSIHYLTLYYLVQPYTENMEAKGMLYHIFNFVIYFASFQAIYNGFVGRSVLVGIGVVSVVYMLVSQVLLKRLAPKTFKLR